MFFSSALYVHIPEELRREVGEMLSILINQHYRYNGRKEVGKLQFGGIRNVDRF